MKKGLLLSMLCLCCIVFLYSFKLKSKTFSIKDYSALITNNFLDIDVPDNTNIKLGFQYNDVDNKFLPPATTIRSEDVIGKHENTIKSYKIDAEFISNYSDYSKTLDVNLSASVQAGLLNISGVLNTSSFKYSMNNKIVWKVSIKRIYVGDEYIPLDKCDRYLDNRHMQDGYGFIERVTYGNSVNIVYTFETTKKEESDKIHASLTAKTPNDFISGSVDQTLKELSQTCSVKFVVIANGLDDNTKANISTLLNANAMAATIDSFDVKAKFSSAVPITCLIMYKNKDVVSSLNEEIYNDFVSVLDANLVYRKGLINIEDLNNSHKLYNSQAALNEIAKQKDSVELKITEQIKNAATYISNRKKRKIDERTIESLFNVSKFVFSQVIHFEEYTMIRDDGNFTLTPRAEHPIYFKHIDPTKKFVLSLKAGLNNEPNANTGRCGGHFSIKLQNNPISQCGLLLQDNYNSGSIKDGDCGALSTSVFSADSTGKITITFLGDDNPTDCWDNNHSKVDKIRFHWAHLELVNRQ